MVIYLVHANGLTDYGEHLVISDDCKRWVDDTHEYIDVGKFTVRRSIHYSSLSPYGWRKVEDERGQTTTHVY